MWTVIGGAMSGGAWRTVVGMQPAAVRNAWRLSTYTMVARFRCGCTRPHDIAMDKLLTTYGNWLAGHIDATGTAVHDPGPANRSTPRQRATADALSSATPHR